MTSPIASIITCAYNQTDAFFRACAESVAAQKEPFEWRVIDDGSAPRFGDRYERIAEQVFGQTPSVSVVHLPKNVGLSAARNVGIAKALGDWIVVLDSDDELTPNSLEQIARLPPSTSLACFAVDYVKSSGDVEHRQVGSWAQLYRRHGRTILDPFLWFDFYYHGIVARRSVINSVGGFDDNLVVGEDQDILLRSLESIPIDSVSFVDSVGYRYRENPLGVCATRWSEVEHNYATTMVQAANRRGAAFLACRLLAPRQIEGALVDEYQYFDGDAWNSWGDLSNEPVAADSNFRECW